jgi:hypothetical protein
MNRSLPLAVVVAVIAVACGDRVASGPSPVSVMADGVKLTLVLDRSEIAPADLLWATLTVENTNEHEVTWAGSGCKVAGQVEAHPAQPDPGRHWPGTLGTFKDWALQNGQTWAYFLFEDFWNRRAAGGVACPAADFRDVLAARSTLRTRWVWDGTVTGGSAGSRPAPKGQLDVVGSFTLGDRPNLSPMRVAAPLRVVGTGDPFISAGVAIDRAYDDGRLARWLEARPAPTSLAGAPVGSIVGSARLSGDAWIIVAAQKTGPAPHEIEVRLAAVDGKVRTVVER